MRTASEIRFVLIDEKAGISEIVKLGDSFQGHVLLSFNAEADILSVQESGSGLVTHLPLKGSAVKDAHWTQNGTVLTILVQPDGLITRDGHQLDAAALAAHFRQAAVDGWLHLRISLPPGMRRELIVKAMHTLRPAFHASGVLGRIIYDGPPR